MYVDADNKRADQNSDMIATCILSYVSPGTRAELHATYNGFNIGRMVYGELVLKGLMNKATSDNKKTTRYLQDQYDNLPSYMTTCDFDITKFILERRKIVSLLEARVVVLTDKFKMMWHDFEICKDAYSVKYMGRKK